MRAIASVTLAAGIGLFVAPDVLPAVFDPATLANLDGGNPLWVFATCG